MNISGVLNGKIKKTGKNEWECVEGINIHKSMLYGLNKLLIQKSSSPLKLEILSMLTNKNGINILLSCTNIDWELDVLCEEIDQEFAGKLFLKTKNVKNVRFEPSSEVLKKVQLSASIIEIKLEIHKVN